MRFHLAITFLPRRRDLRLAAACDEMGYSGIYFSDHLFNPRTSVALHVLDGAGRRPVLGEGDRMARPDVPDLRAVDVTTISPSPPASTSPR